MSAVQPLKLAPIVLFVYRRPAHTLRTLTALQSNALATASTLYVFADQPGPDAPEVLRAATKECVEIARSRPWCGHVHVVERPAHVGLAANIVAGVTEVVRKHGRVIVLEDDIVTSPGFLTYMNRALSIYEHTPRVMHINGYLFPIERPLPPTFMTRWMNCWGWGTWSRAWQSLSLNAARLAKELRNRGATFSFNADGAGNFFHQLQQNAYGEIDSWAVKWHASIYLRGGLCLTPSRSLVDNIGMDGTGTLMSLNHAYSQTALVPGIEVVEQAPVESMDGRRALVRWLLFNRLKWRSKAALELLRTDPLALGKRLTHYAHYAVKG